jgi:IS1 family transposase
MNYNNKILRWTNFKIDLWIWNIICRLGSYVPVWVFFAKKISTMLHEISQRSDSMALRLCTSHHCIYSASFLKSDYVLSAYVSKPGKQSNRADWKSKQERQLVTVASVPKWNTITATQNTDSRFRCDQKI